MPVKGIPAAARAAMTMPAAQPKVPALKRGLAVVRHLNAQPRLSAGVSDIARALGLTKSVCFNILRTLQEEGWVDFDAERRKYTLSGRLLGDVAGLLSRAVRPAEVHAELVRLSAETRVPCVLTRIEPDGTFIAIDKAEEASELLVSVPIGHRFPPDAPAQMRARLAWSDARTRRAALDRWRPVAHTARTIVDRRALQAEIAATRARGYSISRAEFTAGVMTVAAPVLDAGGQPVFVLQCPGVEPDVAAREGEIAAALLTAAVRLATILCPPRI